MKGDRRRGGRAGNGEGSIYRDARGFFRAAITMKDGKRKYFTAKTRFEAAEKRRVALNALANGLPLPGLRLRTDQHLNQWLEETVKPSQKPLTYEKYAQVVRTHLVPSIGKLPLAQLRPEHVQRIQKKMAAKGLSPATINGMRTTLGAALSQAEKWGLVARNVVRLVDPPRSIAAEPRVLRPEEAAAFLAAAKGDSLEHMFTVMLATGLRAGEARGLRWTDVQIGGSSPSINVRRQVVDLQGKGPVFGVPKSTHGRRSIPLIPIAVTALHAQRKIVNEARLKVGPSWRDNDLVFPGAVGEPMSGHGARDHFARIARSAEIKDATPHALRHSTGTFLLAAGVPDRTVQAILGHGSAAMTSHYTHVLPDMLADAGTRLAQFFGAATS